jgi:diadenosine tetraphosphate (Ap4A) HIT family hydrolase
MGSLEPSPKPPSEGTDRNASGCCRLGSEYPRRSNVLYETENFFVVPSIGQIGIEGYVLICSKVHRSGLGDVPPSQHEELEKLLRLTRSVLSSVYGIEPVVFEHGPRSPCQVGGACIDHAHLHVVPAPVDLMGTLLPLLQKRLGLGRFLRIERTEGFHRIREVFEGRKTSYLLCEEADRQRFVVEVDFPIPSQYLRQIIASELGSAEWDWQRYPHDDSFARTIESLKGKFQDGT